MYSNLAPALRVLDQFTPALRISSLRCYQTAEHCAYSVSDIIKQPKTAPQTVSDVSKQPSTALRMSTVLLGLR